MSFAQKQLEKFGWKEGEGLGKKKDGRTKALVTSVKNNTKGVIQCLIQLGCNDYEEWWDTMYNDQAKALEIKKDDKGVKKRLILESFLQ